MSAYLTYRKSGLLTLSVLALLIALIGLFVGSRDITWQVTWQALFHYDASNTEHLLVHYMRLPRAFIAIVAGASLGACGTLVQAFTRNPLADIGILGISAGASTCIVAAIAFWGIHEMTQYLWFGFLGALLSGGFVLGLARQQNSFSNLRFILSGAAISIVLLSLTHIITINSEDSVFDQFRHWASGSLQGRRLDILIPLCCGVIPALFLVNKLGNILNLLALGNQQAKSLGLSLGQSYTLIGLFIVVLAGLTTAAIGPISFIGLIAPHIARTFIGADYRLILPYSMAIGALLLSLADLLGKVIGYPGEVSAGIMASLIGAPFFLFLIMRMKVSKL